MKKLSILICSLQKRKDYLERLKNILKPQVEKYKNDVEVLLNIDAGEKTTGTKRNELLNLSNSEYIAYIDDDDLISSDYIELVLNAIEKKPDVIGIHLLMTINGILKGLTYHSLKYKNWYDEPCINNITLYYRNPNHLNPVKRELALQAKFPEIIIGEDRSYSQKLLPLLKSEEYIIKPIYIYEVRTNK